MDRYFGQGGWRGIFTMLGVYGNSEEPRRTLPGVDEWEWLELGIAKGYDDVDRLYVETESGGG